MEVIPSSSFLTNTLPSAVLMASSPRLKSCSVGFSPDVSKVLSVIFADSPSKE